MLAVGRFKCKLVYLYLTVDTAGAGSSEMGLRFSLKVLFIKHCSIHFVQIYSHARQPHRTPERGIGD